MRDDSTEREKSSQIYPSLEYWDDRRAVVAANSGSAAISIVSLLPDAPKGVWARVSEIVATLQSPTRFLSHLFVEVTSPNLQSSHAPRIQIDGFLGSGGHAIDPWTLLPAAGVWIRSRAGVRPAIRHLEDAFAFWYPSGLPKEYRSERVPNADSLGPFLPYGRILNRSVVNLFLTEARQLLPMVAPESSR